jgi:hypothetical protein
MRMTRSRLALTLASALAPAFALAQAHRPVAPNSVRSDPSPAVRPAASMDEIAIPSHGARMNGVDHDSRLRVVN